MQYYKIVLFSACVIRKSSPAKSKHICNSELNYRGGGGVIKFNA
jgi:hypothetical protein